MSPEHAAPSTPEIVCVVLRPDDAEPAIRLAAALADRMSLPLALVDVQVPVPPVAGVPVAGSPMYGAQPVVAPLGATDPLGASGPAQPGVEPPGADLRALADAAGARPSRLDAVMMTPERALADLSAAPRTELLVVTDQGGGPLRSAVPGNPGRRAMRDVACPLVLVPSGHATALAQAPRILCGVAEEDVAPTVVAYAGHLARSIGAALHVVHVSEERRDAAAAIDRLQRLVESVLPPTEDVSVSSVVGDSSETLASVAREDGAALVVLGRPERGALGSALSGSVVHDLLETGGLPVIVVPDAATAAAG